MTILLLAIPACAGTGSEAGNDYANPPEGAIRDRDLLREVTEGHGFVALDTEGWHYACHLWYLKCTCRS